MSKETYFYNKHTLIAILMMEDGVCTYVKEKHNLDFAPMLIRDNFEPDYINLWLEKRAIPDKRDGLSQIIENFGEDWNKQTHYASLTDQYWLTEDPCEKWDDINFFTNFYSLYVGDLFFKEWTIQENKTVNSPDITTNGILKKRWIQNEDKTSSLIKAGNLRMKQEPLNEVLASVLLEKLDIIPFVKYDFYIEGFTLCSICKNFIDENTEYIPASQLLIPKKVDNDDYYKALLIEAERLGVENYKDFLDAMILVDYITQNVDRHLGNFGFIRNVNTGKIIGPAPIFDNGVAFWNNNKEILTLESKLFNNKIDILNEQRGKHMDKLKLLAKDNGYKSLIHQYPSITDKRKEHLIDGIEKMYNNCFKKEREIILQKPQQSLEL